MKKIEKEFRQISEFIDQSRNAAVGFMNYAAVATYWAVGAFVSLRLKSAAWGSRTVVELGDYLKTRNPKLKGFGRRQIYNMVEFYETYSSAEFHGLYEQLKLEEFVQLPTAQTTDDGAVYSSGIQTGECGAIVQLKTAQLGDKLLNVGTCPHADRCDVKYTLDRTMSPMIVAEYRRLLIPEEVMKKSLEEYCAFMKEDAAGSGGKKGRR